MLCSAARPREVALRWPSGDPGRILLGEDEHATVARGGHGCRAERGPPGPPQLSGERRAAVSETRTVSRAARRHTTRLQHRTSTSGRQSPLHCPAEVEFLLVPMTANGSRIDKHSRLRYNALRISSARSLRWAASEDGGGRGVTRVHCSISGVGIPHRSD